MASAGASANDGTQERICNEERRRLRSLLCGPGSARLPGRTPRGGVFGPRRASCASCTTSSPTLAIFGPLEVVVQLFCRIVATVIRSCRSHERSRRCRRLIAAPVVLPTPSMVDNLKAQQKSPTQTEQPV